MFPLKNTLVAVAKLLPGAPAVDFSSLKFRVYDPVLPSFSRDQDARLFPALADCGDAEGGVRVRRSAGHHAVFLVDAAAGKHQRARKECVAMALHHQHFEPGRAVAQQQQGRGRLGVDGRRHRIKS